jgi:hypothetical protein
MRGKNGPQPVSTGLWLKLVLKVPLFHRFVTQTGAKGALRTGAKALRVSCDVLASRTGANAPFSLGS